MRSNRFGLIIAFAVLGALWLVAATCNIPRTTQRSEPTAQPEPTRTPATPSEPTADHANDDDHHQAHTGDLTEEQLVHRDVLATTDRFVNESASRLPLVYNVNYGIDVGDIDGDGDIDIWVADCGRGGDQLLLNDGGGFFSDGTDEQISRPGAPEDYRRTSKGEDANFADVDGDGDLDVYVNSDLASKERGPVYERPEAMFINDGIGNFVDEIEERVPREVTWRHGASDLASFADLDGDNDLDFVRITREPLGTAPVLQSGRTGMFLNDGAGFFSDGTDRLPDDSGWFTGGLGLADVDLDGDIDIITNHRDMLRIYANDGQANYTDLSHAMLPPRFVEGRGAGRFAIGDIDNDGDTDILGSEVILRYEQASGRFVADDKPPLQNAAGLAIVGDVNNDGYLDMIAVQEAEDSTSVHTHDPVLLLNDQQGALQSPELIADMPKGTVIQEMGVADVDGDGDLDLYVGTGVPPHDHPGHEGREDGIQHDVLFINTLISK